MLEGQPWVGDGAEASTVAGRVCFDPFVSEMSASTPTAHACFPRKAGCLLESQSSERRGAKPVVRLYAYIRRLLPLRVCVGGPSTRLRGNSQPGRASGPAASGRCHTPDRGP